MAAVGEVVQISVTAEAEPGGLGGGLAAPDRGLPLEGRVAVFHWHPAVRVGVHLITRAVSKSRIGAVQVAHVMSIGPVNAQVGKPPTRQPGGIESVPW
ncbi:hypothetical protein ABZZ01_21665 [Streptomyces virginiae]|uniref:hypothetical protein n=1 Tax=Streptomyces virginiae TaxID=1961 RepID=UPI0033B5B2E7